MGHDSGILHQPVLSPALPKVASSVSEAFEQMPNESRIEMVQQGRPGRYLACIQYLTPLLSAGKRNTRCGSAVQPPGSPIAQGPHTKNVLGEE